MSNSHRNPQKDLLQNKEKQFDEFFSARVRKVKFNKIFLEQIFINRRWDKIYPTAPQGVKQIVETEIEVENKIHLLFIILTKAYDKVPITKLWNVLNEMNINPNIIRASQELYRQSKTKTKIGQRLSKGFITDKE